MEIGKLYSHGGRVVRYRLIAFGKIGFQLAWSLIPGDWWYKDCPGDRPFLWVGKHITANSATIGFFAGRLALLVGIAWRGKLGEKTGRGGHDGRLRQKPPVEFAVRQQAL